MEWIDGCDTYIHMLEQCQKIWQKICEGHW